MDCQDGEMERKWMNAWKEECVLGERRILWRNGIIFM